MKFLKEPQIRRDEDGKKVLYLTNEEGNIYYLKGYRTWKNICIAQEPGGHYAIIKANSRVATEFIYKKVQYTKRYLFAFYKEEMDSRNYFHVYNLGGASVTYEREDETTQGNGFICIWESSTKYFIDSQKQKAYSKHHPKYWVKRLL